MKRLAILAGAMAVLAACGDADPMPETVPTPVVQAAPDVKLYTMDCGRFTTGNAEMFSDEGAYNGFSVELVNPCYLIRHPAGDLLWDTGIPSAAATAPPEESNGFQTTLERTLEDQLTELGLTPDDIEFVSFSHSHFDHVGNANLFANATWIVDADELAWMFRDEARASPEFANYSQLEQSTQILIEGENTHDVFGDGSVVIHQAPGHTPGHTVLFVKFAISGPALLSGDMWHLAEARERRTVPQFNTDREQTLASMDKVEQLARQSGARVVRQHVPEDFDELPAFPAALD
jgi:N-acyl homoserine lactone hydrolase